MVVPEEKPQNQTPAPVSHSICNDPKYIYKFINVYYSFIILSFSAMHCFYKHKRLVKMDRTVTTDERVGELDIYS